MKKKCCDFCGEKYLIVDLVRKGFCVSCSVKINDCLSKEEVK